MKAKEAKKIVKKMADGKYHRLQSDLAEFPDGEVELTHTAYIEGTGGTRNLRTWREVIEELKGFQRMQFYNY